ncbi:MULTISPECIES: hypothetical protein [unclassified Pseudomonas]|uniref:hypothetical protein n=1 Tax=unclassified Pseudomonas TaxID=196821 RepID=UPI000F56B242|nr:MULTISPECIES: hypothetical protein [unclassified Pseudomonas]AZF27978.1 hypothetical protein C4J90_3822 [Pseudomonas sp. R2-60-08W]AZF33296.1 hypothetical protein C4J89_3838 [Pseudomonas sp. R4-35-07]
MSVISAYNPAVRVPFVPDAEASNEADEKAPAIEKTTQTKVVEGVTVTISAAAFQAAGAAKSSNSDIDDSGLDDNVKQVLKMIRQLKQQIAEKQAELAAVAAANNLSPEEARARTSALQSEISSLQAGLMSAQTSLAKSMKGMSAEDSMKAASLSM